MYKRDPTPAIKVMLALCALSSVFAFWDYLQGEIPLKAFLGSLLLPVFFLLIWFGQALFAIVMYPLVCALVWLLHSPLFIIGYIADWIQRLRKKDP